MSQAMLQSFRSLRQRPAFTGFTLSLVTLGVGAASAIFGVVHGSLLRPLPYRQPAALYAISTNVRATADSVASGPLSAHELVRWRADSRALSSLEGYSPVTVKITGGAAPEALPGMAISAGFFDLLGATPQLGRAFRRDEEIAGSGVAIISARLWITRFGRDPNILRRTVTIDDEPREIVGVMPASFSMLFQPSDVWLPMILTSDRLTGPARLIGGVGRLRDGASVSQVLSELSRMHADLSREEPDVYRGVSPLVTPLHEFIFGSQRTTLMILLLAVTLLVVIGAVNVAGLVGADVVARRIPTMTRLALGANRRQLVAGRLREGMALAALAIVPALLGAAALLALVRTLNPGMTVGPDEVVHPAVLSFAIAIALVMGVGTMLPPALAEASVNVSTLAGAATRTAGGRRERVGRDMVLASQVAITVVLLVAATVLTRNLNAMMNRWPGFEQQGVLVAPLALSIKTYPGVEARATHVKRILAEIRQVPGVSSAGTIQTRFIPNENMQTAIEVDGRPADPDVQQSTNIRHASPSIFRVLRTRVIAGRGFDETDREGSRLVAVVNSSFVRSFLGGGNPVGMRVRRANRKDAPWLEIVGVVEDVNDAGAGVDLGPTMYVSYYQQNTVLARVTLVVRTVGDPARLAAAVRRAIWNVDPDQAIESTIPLSELMSRSAAEPRLRAVLVGLFGAAGLLLVLTGIYATTQYSVIRRTREIGVRAALGAQPNALLRKTMVDAVRPAAVGLAVGVLAAVPVAWTMQSSLKESLTIADAPMLVAVLAVFIGLAIVAAFLPARRATTIPPTVAMRA